MNIATARSKWDQIQVILDHARYLQNTIVLACRGRYHSLHLKGRLPDNIMTDVGSGAVDWPRILPAARAAGAGHFFVEHDDPADAFHSVRASLNYLRSLPP